MCGHSLPVSGLGSLHKLSASVEDGEKLEPPPSPVPPRAGEGGQVILNVGFILQLVINVTASLSTRTILLIWLIQLQLTALGFPNFPIRILDSKGHGFISLLTNGMG